MNPLYTNDFPSPKGACTYPLQDNASPITRVVWNRAAIFAVAALSVFGLLTGCSERNEADAGSKEIRLTSASSFHNNPRISPDGDTIAFTEREGGDFSIYFMDANLMDAASPEMPKRLPGFDLNAIFAQWHPDGDRFYVVTIPMGELKLVSMEGKVLEDVNATPLAYLMDINSEGTEGLYTKFNGDNHDCGVADFATGEFAYIAETPRWEVSANYGPGPHDITVASLPDYGAKVSDIRVFNRKDGTMEILPLGAGRLSEPTWSNNRKYMIYTAFASGSRDLFLYDRENLRSIPLTHGPEEDTSPSWSPDDEEIIFLRKNSFTQVFFYDTETEESRALTTGDSRRSAPRLSDDGEWVAYVERPLDSPGNAAPKSRLVAISMETGDQRVLADNIEASSEGAYSFSEDGSQIAFAANDGKGNTDIYRVSIEGGEPIPVTVNAGTALMPTWSQDGSRIAYTQVAEGVTQVWTVPSTGGNPKRMSYNPGINQYGLYSDDATQMSYFSMDEKDGSCTVWIVDAEDPTQGRQVFRAKQVSVPIAWCNRDNTLLVYRLPEEAANRNKGGFMMAVPIDGSEPYVIAYPKGLKSPEAYLMDFSEKGEKYREEFYPGGGFAYAEGDEGNNIYRLEIAPFLQEDLARAGR